MIEKVWKILGGRKFVAFIVATVLLIFEYIDGTIWLWAFGIYCAANLLKAIAQYLPSKKAGD